MVFLRFLGGASLEDSRGVIAGPAAQRHRIALAAMVAAAHPGGVSRDRLMACLWPERDPKHARNLLNQAVHALRRAMGAGALVSGGGELRLNIACVHCDLIAFNTALEGGELEDAAALYAGHFLEGFHLQHAPEFAAWQEGERERARRAYTGSLEQLADAASGRGDSIAAAEWYRRLAALDPFSDRFALGLMKALDRAGDRAAAIHHAEVHARLLREELEAEPHPEVTALAARLKAGPNRRNGDIGVPGRSAGTIESPARRMSLGPHAAAPPVSYALIGRQAEWQHLLQAWRRSVRDGPLFVLITGESGIGKTRLAEEMLGWASRQGIPGARTRSYAAEGRLAYAPVADWLRSPVLRAGLGELDPASLAEVARLLPELTEEYPDLPQPAPLTESWQQQRFATALARAVLHHGQPLLLMMDDLQWSDRDTLRWLRFLLRFDPTARALVLGAARTEEVSSGHPLADLMFDLRRDGNAVEIELGPLSPTEVAALGSQVAGHSLVEEDAAELARDTEGIPLFVVENLRWRLLGEAGPARAAGPAATGAGSSPESAGGMLPPRIQAVIRSRLAQLSDDARGLAGLAAAIGRDFDVDVLGRAAVLDEPRLIVALEELCDRRVIREHGARSYDFTHDKLREEAYTQIGTARRRSVHRRIAEALQFVHAGRLDAVAAQVAAHYERGGLAERAITYYRRAAEVASAVFANDDAIDLLRRAIRLVAEQPVGPDRDRVELALQIALGAVLRVARGWAAAELGEAMLRARELCGPDSSRTERLQALTGLHAFVYVRGSDLEEARGLGTDLIGLASEQGEVAFLVGAHFQLGSALLQIGEFESALDHVVRGATLYEPGQHRHFASYYGCDFGVLCSCFASHASWHLGNDAEALAWMEKARLLALHLDDPFSRTVAAAYESMLHQFRGDARACAVHARGAVALSRKHGFPYYEAWGTILRGWALAQRGRAEPGITAIEEGLAAMEATGAALRRPYYLSLLAEACGRAGRLDVALGLVSDALSIADTTSEHWRDADFHRIRGELFLAKARATAAEGAASESASESLRQAELAFRQAIETGSSQGAHAFVKESASDRAALLRSAGWTDGTGQIPEDL